MGAFEDQYADTNGTTLATHVSDSGNSYTGTTANWEIQNNRVTTNTATTVSCQVAGYTASNEYSVYVQARRVTSNGNIAVFICADGDPLTTGSGYLLQFFSNYCRLVKWTNGAFDAQLHASSLYDTVVDNDSYHEYKIDISATDIVIWSGAGTATTIRYTSSETTYRGSQLWLRGSGANSASVGYHIDDITVVPVLVPINQWDDGTYPVSYSANSGVDTDTANLYVYPLKLLGEYQHIPAPISGDIAQPMLATFTLDLPVSYEINTAHNLSMQAEILNSNEAQATYTVQGLVSLVLDLPQGVDVAYSVAALNIDTSISFAIGQTSETVSAYSVAALAPVIFTIGQTSETVSAYGVVAYSAVVGAEIVNDMIPRLLSTDVHEVTVFKTRGNRFKVVISQDGTPVDLSIFDSFELHGLRATAITSSEAGAIDWADGNGQIFLDVGSLATVSGSAATTLIGFSAEYPEGAILWHPNLAQSHVTVNLIDA